MKHYNYADLQVGHEESFRAIISEEDMVAFRHITGDENPLHCDEEYAKAHGLNGRAIYGMLTASYLSTLAGMYLPGKRSLIHQVKVDFLLPNMGIDSGITVSGIVVKKWDKFRRLSVNVSIVNDFGDKLVKGTMEIEVLE